MTTDTYLRFVLALLFVLALIGVLAWLARRVGLGNRIARTAGARRRLSVSEVNAIDGKHRLVLVRRDDIEHLIMLGPQQDLVIEAGIPVPEVSEESVKQSNFKQQVTAKLGRTPKPSPATKKTSARGAKA